MKNIVFFGLVGFLALGSIVFAAHQNEFNLKEHIKKYELEKQKEINITTKEIKSKSEELEVDLKIPVISGLDDMKIEKQINDTFEKHIVDFKNEIEEGSKEFIKEAKKEGWEIRPFTALSEYKVSYNKNNLISISITNYEYTGGAHGSADTRNYTIDMKTGKELTLKDIFKEKADFKEIINKEIENKIKIQTESGEFSYFDGEMGFKSISENQSFYIKDGKLVIHFGLYEIAPYASGMPEFEIPFLNLKNIIKSEILSN